MKTTVATIENTPAIKEIKPINFLYFRTETTLHDLVNFIPVAKELAKESVALGLHICGACHWHYFGFDGDESKTFTLEVALPVDKVITEYDGNFHFKRTESFRCLALTHEGGWNTIPESYGKMMAFIGENNLHPTGVTREIYINVDFQDLDANLTLIQMGIQ